MSHNELMNVVSDQDKVIDILPRSDIYARGLNFRVINAFIVNSRGQLWIPRRHHAKKLFPLALDTSIGGHVKAGESYDEAFARETSEEVNINVKHAHCKLLAKLTPPQHGTSAFMHVYAIYQDIEPQYNQNDFVESFWLSPHELLCKISAGQEEFKGDLPIIVTHIKNLL